MRTRFPGFIQLANVAVAHAPCLRRCRLLALAAASIGLLALGQAMAQEAPRADAAQVAAEQNPRTASARRGGRDGQVCHYEEVTGSRMKKRVCFTPEQLEARERAGRQLVRDLDAKPLGENVPGG